MLTQFLVAHQSRQCASDEEFSARLGIEPELWAALRSGGAAYSATLIARILTRFPIALSAALDDLRLQDGGVWAAAEPPLAAVWAVPPAQPAGGAAADTVPVPAAFA